MVIETIVMDEIAEEGREGAREEGLSLSSRESQHFLPCGERRQNVSLGRSGNSGSARDRGGGKGVASRSRDGGLSMLSVVPRLKVRNNHWWCGYEVIGDLCGS